ncbi:UDP-N-acetylglucosamine 2-epimerase [Glaciecola punicea]|uniref:UDP-N-acetylglucosamine 2-epimerase n=1 Tax=Glaciecola punicea TaxID=56804 RepID=UPI0009F6EE4F|nr:UDP-N-acetylglucosamine 2-epimerase [Glaciecola punicea]
MLRKIAVFTGTRAEYGLLYWIIRGLHESTKVELQLYVGGMHLSHEFGYTVSQIEKDNFPVTERMEFLLSSDSAVGISKSMGLALINSAEVLERNKPDLIVLLGDRFESMTVAQAAMIACIPIAHIHGGETTEGVVDEAVRHSITKMAHLHFAATDNYMKRIQQLGEQPERIFNFGAPGIDNIVNLELLKRDELSNSLEFILEKPYFIVTYHPVTLEIDGAANSLINLLKVLDEYPNHQLVITYPNADTNGRKLIEILDEYQCADSKRILLTRSLGQIRYLSAMKYCDAVIGNSSSGLIESPTFCVPTVNIGNRQKGRIAGDTVLHCADSVGAIRETIEKALSEEFKMHCKKAINPYGLGESSKRIVDVLITYPLKGIVSKKFYDLIL